jgi:uncharacterized protein YjbK
MTLRKPEDSGIWRRKHELALSGELALEETMDMSQDRLHSDWMNAHKIRHDIIFVFLRNSTTRYLTAQEIL